VDAVVIFMVVVVVMMVMVIMVVAVMMLVIKKIHLQIRMALKMKREGGGRENEDYIQTAVFRKVLY
jgi:hypothetical protein